jgi:hypothetical protein
MWIGNRKATRISESLIERSAESKRRLEQLVEDLEQARTWRANPRETAGRLERVCAQLMDVPVEDLDAFLKSIESEQPYLAFVPKGDAMYVEPSVVLETGIGLPTREHGVETRTADFLKLYFPQCDTDRFECPLPLTEEFWKRYCEPVREIVSIARTFFFVANNPHSSDALHHLQTFIQPAGVALSPGPDGRIEERWQCPSLLSSFGRMLLQDISAGKRMLLCECCQQAFVTDNYQSLYCSQRCGYKVRQRRLRAKTSGTNLTKEPKHGKTKRQ